MNPLKDQQKLIELEIAKLEAMGGHFTGQAKGLRDSVFKRFPAVFILLSTFGVVATLYGFEKVIDEMDWLASRPWAILVLGLGTLLFTGTLYKKLR